MKNQIIIQVIIMMLKSLDSQQFKLMLDSMLDSLEGQNNENQRTWHIIIRTILNVPDND